MFVISFTGFSQSDSASKKFSDVVKLKGYVKNMQSLQMADLNYVSHNNLIHNRLNFRIYPSKQLSVGVELRNRVFTGDQVNFNPYYSKAVDFDHGLVDMSWAWLDESGVVGLSQVDRGWVKWNNSRWDITVGRQRINWGVNAFWNSNDLFNTFNLVDFDYEERPGTDAVRVQHFFKNYSSLDIAVKPSKYDSTWVGAGMYKFNKWTYDFQVLGGWWNEDIAIGAGWAGNLKTASFKGEVTYFHPQENWQDTAGAVTASISIDYAFSGGLYVMGGLMYGSLGADTTLNLTALANSAITSTTPPSAKNLMPTKYNAMLSLSRSITPLITGSLVGIYSPGVNLMFLMPSISIAVANNWDFSIFGQSTFLDNGANFRNYGTSVFARLKWGF
ncbi:MAG: hypothetical protein R2813_04130 [Flavobacteriales bacterium]